MCTGLPVEILLKQFHIKKYFGKKKNRTIFGHFDNSLYFQNKNMHYIIFPIHRHYLQIV